MSASILTAIAEKGSDKAKIAQKVIANSESIAEIIPVLSEKKGTLKFGCEKVLRLVSEERPDLVYPYFEDYVKLLDSENNFIKWGAILTLANLVKVDEDRRFDKILDKYLAPIQGPVMVAAANTIGGLIKIVESRPDLANRITREILKIRTATYIMHGEPSPECHNVICGHAIDAFGQIYDLIEDKKDIHRFVEAQRNNTRPQVQKKAEKFLKKFQGDLIKN